MTGDTPRYATLLYEVRRLLNVSFTEYVYLDMVHKLSYDRWCNKSLENTAYDLGLKKRAVIYMRDRLIDKGLLKRNARGELKVTDVYIKLAVMKPQPGKVQNLHGPVQNLHSNGAKFAPKNNNRNTENFKKEMETVEKPVENHRGQYSPAKEKLRKMIESKKLGDQLTLTGG